MFCKYENKTQFSRWLSDDSNLYDPIFWITGKPGSGKSTLMRFALEDSRTREMLPDATGEPIAYFFHLRGKVLVQKSLYGILKELIFGLLTQFEHFFVLVKPIFQRLRKVSGTPKWDIYNLKEMIIEIPKLKSSTPGKRDRIVLFIDALDENENQKDNEKMIGILKVLSSSYNDIRQGFGSPVLKICLASRPWPLFQSEFGTNVRIPSFAIHNFTASDIKSYSMSLLKKPISRSEVAGDTHSAMMRLSQDITMKARGVFVWVRIVVDNLRQQIVDGTPVQTLQKIILGYPEELKDFYKYTISRIPPQYCQETEVALKVLLSSRTSLSFRELFNIVQICVGNRSTHDPALDPANFDLIERWLNSRSGGLIEVIDDGIGSEPTGQALKVQFIHQTAQDFVREGISGLPNTLRPGKLHFQASGSRLIALACLDSHPPHYDLRRVSKQLFAYLRDVEQEIDTDPHMKVSQLQCLPEWKEYTLHKLPAFKRDIKASSNLVDNIEELSFYLEDHEKLTRDQRLQDCISWGGFQLPFFMTVSQNLYHTIFPLGALDFPRMLLHAALGPRLSEDRLDRPRMFRRILEESNKGHLAKNFVRRGLLNPPSSIFAHLIRHAQQLELLDSRCLSILHCLAITEGDGEISSEDILEMANILLDAGADPSQTLCNRSGGFELSLLNFCARFKGDTSGRWVELLHCYGATLLSTEKEVFNELVQSSVAGEKHALTLDPNEASKQSAVSSSIVLSSLCLSAVGTGNVALKSCHPSFRERIYGAHDRAM